MTDLSESVRRLEAAPVHVENGVRHIRVQLADRDAVLEALERRTAALREIAHHLEVAGPSELLPLAMQARAALAGEEPQP